MSKYVLAIDSFKECLTSMQAEEAAKCGILQAEPQAEVISIPMTDGGEGMLDVLQKLLDAETIDIAVHDPLMRPITASYAVTKDTAIIEVAKAIGLNLLEPSQRNPLKATSFGVGEIIADGLRRGCKKFIVGLGGTATSDCGTGMLKALIQLLSTSPATSDNWDTVSRHFEGINFILACDVKNPLYGPSGAAQVFAPQKGANPDDVVVLDRKAQTFADVSARHFGFDFSQKSGAGAAGGLGYAFMQYLHAEFKSGINMVMNLCGFDEMAKNADLVITGEGCADAQTLMGKVPSGVLKRCQALHIPVILLAGKIQDTQLLLKSGFKNVLSINPIELPMEKSLEPNIAKQNIINTVKGLLAH